MGPIIEKIIILGKYIFFASQCKKSHSSWQGTQSQKLLHYLVMKFFPVLDFKFSINFLTDGSRYSSRRTFPDRQFKQYRQFQTLLERHRIILFTVPRGMSYKSLGPSVNYYLIYAETLQLNKYETVSNFMQLTQNLTSNYLLIQLNFPFLPVLA